MGSILIWIALGAFAAWALWRAWRGAKAQIAADEQTKALGDPARSWRGAQRYGGGFPKDSPPDEDVVQKTWACIHMGEQVSSFVKGAEGPPLFNPKKLSMLCKWCDAHCNGAWIATLLEERHLTVWFEQAEDAQAFALTWTPRRTM